MSETIIFSLSTFNLMTFTFFLCNLIFLYKNILEILILHVISSKHNKHKKISLESLTLTWASDKSFLFAESCDLFRRRRHTRHHNDVIVQCPPTYIGEHSHFLTILFYHILYVIHPWAENFIRHESQVLLFLFKPERGR